MYTEEEAKKRWCPFGRVARASGASVNRGVEETFCIASKCMAWRWDMQWESSTEEGVGGDLVLRLKPLKGKPRQGFCGLAGKP